MISPGWYPDPAEPETRRYWNGEEWLGDPIGIDDPIPSEPPKPKPEPAPQPPVADPAYGPRARFDQDGTSGRWPADNPSDPTRPGANSPGTRGQGAGGQGAGDPGSAGGLGGLGGLGPTGGGALGDLPGDVPPAELATLTERLAARVLDLLAVFLLNVVVNGWFVYQYVKELAPLSDQMLKSAMSGNPTTAPPTDSNLAGQSLLITLIALALWFAYEVPSVWNSGQTLGKRLIGIQVRFRFGAPMTFGLSMRRWWVQSLTLLCWPVGPLIGAADALWCTWDPMRQCLHDKTVATLVVRKPLTNSTPDPTANDDTSTDPSSNSGPSLRKD